ncbi:hypothetical protein HNP84_009579 [Thermocatellispora tengchongensis]|uniref:Uncharacterized protein n=1 Tax=Thermocatellispora tengchongensis TaxID=1073253 RepID=A0A840PVA0_9ACTN|nr:hypothetical protein [Thermocatellispora tengchongensis]MBB5139815.1 hypothetical protein [Thermocatellispora tengchongensis]
MWKTADKPAFFATWAALALHSCVSSPGAPESAGEVAQALVTAGAVGTADAPKLTKMQKSAAIDLGTRKVRSALSEVQWNRLN